MENSNGPPMKTDLALRLGSLPRDVVKSVETRKCAVPKGKRPKMKTRSEKHKHADEQMRKLSAAVEQTADTIVITDRRGMIEYVNPAFEELTGYRKEEVLGKNPRILKSGKHDRRFYEELWRTILSGKPFRTEFINKKKNGEEWIEEQTITPLRNTQGGITHFIATGKDITVLKRTHEVLLAKETHLKETQRVGAIGSWELDLRTNMFAWSEEIYRTFEIDRGRVAASYEDFLDAIHPDDREAVNQAYTQSVKNRTRYDVVHRLLFPDARVKFVHARCETFYDSDGTPLKSIGTAQDITERKKAERALHYSEERFRTLFEFAPDAYFLMDIDGTLVDGNASTETLTGYKRFELTGKNFVTAGFIDPADIARASESFSRRLQGEPVENHEYTLHRKSGEKVVVDLRTIRMNVAGQDMVLGIVRDITERKRAETVLRASEAKLSNALEIAHLGHWEYDVASDLFTFNDQFYAMFHTTVEQVGGYTMTPDSYAQRFLHPDDIPLVRIETRKALETTDPHYSCQLDHRIIYADGGIGYITVRIFLVKDDQGHTIKTYGVNQDITERKRAEEAVQESRRLYQELVENINEIIFSLDEKGNVTYISPVVEVVGRYTPAELVGRSFAECIHPDDLSDVQKGFELVLTGQSARSDFRSRTKSGEYRWVESSSRPLIKEGKVRGIRGALTDVTDRKLAELEIRRNEEWLHAILEASRDGILAEKDRTIAYVNTSFAHIFGYDDPSELVGRDVTAVLASDESLRLMEFSRSRLGGESAPSAYEFRGIRKDGRAVDLEASVSTASIGGEEYIISTVRDISERKLLQKQLIEVQKMESIGTLAGGIAHDFNNILGIIMGHSTLLDRTRQDPEKFAQSADAISKATFRGAGLVRQLLTFARKTDIAMQSVLVNDTIKELARLLQEILPKTIILHLDLSEKLPSILADPTQLHQVFLNLCVNARDAMTPKGGTLTLASRLVSGEATSVRFPRANAMEYMIVDVSDTGSGMDEATRSHIFEPFFTTKEKGKGTGLGLATVYGIIESHGGFIDVESTLGVGSTFHVYLPVEPRQVKPREAEKAAEKDVPGGTDTLLLVEDEETLRGLIAAVLEGKGYEVLQAADGEEGLRLFADHQEKIALVLSDLGLPKMSGEDLLHRMLELKPQVRVLVASGYVEPNQKSEMLKCGIKEFVQKPYDPIEVVKKIREVLDTD
jgi:PAS domain S-box-containing protein